MVTLLPGPFQGADFDADPSAAFSEGMSAAMDYMADAGMPAPMMEMMQDFCTGAFEQHMAGKSGFIQWMHLMLLEVLSTV